MNGLKGDKLRGIIVAKGMTQHQVAREIGISPKTFYNKMKKGIFDTDEVRKMAAVLEINNLSELADIFLRD